MLLKKKKDQAAWVRYVHARIRKKKNFLPRIVGATGSGKSWSALSMALMFDPDFSADRVVFGLRGLMDLINSKKKYKAGSCFVWDEFQLDAGSRQWQSLTNKLLNSLLQTFRNKYFILIITTPYSDFIDSQSRKLMHAEFETIKIDYEKEQVKLKPMLLQYNSRQQKTYHKYLRIVGSNGLLSPVVSWCVNKPPKWLVDSYETRKTEFTDKLNKDISKELDIIEVKQSERKPLTELQEKCLTQMAKYDDVEKVAVKLGLTTRTIFFHLAQAKKKGYNLQEFKEMEGKTTKPS